MPKVLMYTLEWSSTRATYELYRTQGREILQIIPDSHAWFAWLNDVSSFAFIGQSGHYTARKEARQQREKYWYAYQTRGARLSKKYLGKSADVTLARLELLAEMFSSQGENEPGTRPLAPEVIDGNMETSPPPEPDQQHYPSYLLLANKLHMPRMRTQLVSRDHLIERLQQGIGCLLTLISAPAGFGKTTLLTQWFNKSGIPVAWLSLEPEDNDPIRFLTYVTATLQTIDSRIGEASLALLRTQQQPPPETILAMLANDLEEQGSGDIALVLDDYHVITSIPIQQGMTFLLSHMPPQLHLTLATRADPPLPLARLRACGQLSEIRIIDLRFSSNEARTFLQMTMGLQLSDKDMVTLETRTEGWIAGLQLAALSLQGRDDTSGFLANFAGTNRFVLDYLSEEVLLKQLPAVQTFLLHTSILDRLSGPLCDAVMKREGSQEMLEMLEKANLFVVTLDDERHWYRYHRLFADMLQRHLQQINPTILSVLHRRASAWCEQNNLPVEAVQHALAASDVELAARLVESLIFPLVFHGQLYTVLEWMKVLPEATICTRPFLCVYHARLLMYTNQYEAVDMRLQQAEEMLRTETLPEQVKSIRGWACGLRASIHAFSGDLLSALPLAHQSLQLLPKRESIARAGAILIQAHNYLIDGNVASEREQEVATAVHTIGALDNPFALVGSIAVLARLHILQGRLQQAANTYAQMLQVVPYSEVLNTAFINPHYHFGLAPLLYEKNDLKTAERHLMQGIALVQKGLMIEALPASLGYTTLSRLRQAQGDFSAARTMLDSLEQLSLQRHFATPFFARLAAWRAHLELLQGNLAVAIQWADTCGLSLDDTDVLYFRESEYITLARVRIREGWEYQAEHLLQSALSLLDRLLQDAQTKKRLDSLLEILLVRALAFEMQENRRDALASLERALVLAEPEGYIRRFIDEGLPMQNLLRHAQAHGITLRYVATLLRVFGEQQTSPVVSPVGAPDPLAEVLSGREREVLALLLAGASNREIARRLVLSINTVKRHVYNLCGKLGVQSRTQAINRARSLNLL